MVFCTRRQSNGHEFWQSMAFKSGYHDITISFVTCPFILVILAAGTERWFVLEFMNSKVLSDLDNMNSLIALGFCLSSLACVSCVHEGILERTIKNMHGLRELS